jgi:hypothetical protein
MAFVLALSLRTDDVSFEVARMLGCSAAITSIVIDGEVHQAFHQVFASGSRLRERLKLALVTGRPVRWIAALRGLRRIAPDMEEELLAILARPRLQRSAAERTREIRVQELVALLKWSYRVLPEFGERIEREVHPGTRRRMAMELVDNLPWTAGAERWGGVAPVLDDVLREVGRLTDGALPRVQHGPLGISRETIANLEKDPRNGLSDLQGALRFADARHPSRRRQIASDAVARTVRDMSNLEGIVDDVFQHRLSDVSWALRGSLGKAPELHAVLRGRLARDAFLEELIDKSLGSSHVSEYGALLSALSLADPRIHANAIEILSTPERASALARRALTVGPANWIGLLRQPEVARAVLGHVEEKRWAEYWSCLPPAFPDWSRALQFQLRRYGFSSLGQAPAEYILLGTGPDQWSRENVSLRDLSNALYGGGSLGDRLALRFLDRIGFDALVDKRYSQSNLWTIVDFLRALYDEQPRVITRKMITPTLTERVRRDGEVGWSSPDLHQQIGFIALVGTLALAGVDLRLPLELNGMAERARIVEISEGHPGGHPFVEAGLRRLALI